MPAATDGQTSSGHLTPDQASAVALRTAAVPAVIVGVLAVVLGWVLRGPQAALGAALGAIVAIAFFAVGQYVLGRILSGNPDLALSGGLLLYLTQVLVLFGLIVLLRDATWLDGRVFGVTVLAVTIAWIVGSIVANMRVKVLYVDPKPEADETAAEPAAGEGEQQ
jgi:ATP synthase protein I